MGFLTPSGFFESFSFNYCTKSLKFERSVAFKLPQISAKQEQLFPRENKKFPLPCYLTLRPAVF